MNLILNNKNTYSISNNFKVVKEIPNGVYNLEEDILGNFSLEYVGNFKIPKKIYNNDTEFIKHILNVIPKINENVGIALIGEKGLGKSFTAKLIASQLNKPVIVIKDQLKTNAFSFLESIPCEYVLFIDEYEKSQLQSRNSEENKNKIGNLLSFLDGTYTGQKFTFILTGNSDISKYLLNRPSRIRYYKEYRTLEKEVIKEIIDDLLVNKNHKDYILKNLSNEGINIDVLIKIIEECNLTNLCYSQFESYFNYIIEHSDINILIKDEIGILKSIGKLKNRKKQFYYELDYEEVIYNREIKIVLEEYQYADMKNNLAVFKGYIVDENKVKSYTNIYLRDEYNKLSNYLTF